VAAAVPVLRFLNVNEPEIGVVNQGRRLQRLARLLLRHPFGSKSTQFVIDERKQLLRGAGVALLDRGQDASNVAHEREHIRQSQQILRPTPEQCVALFARRQRRGEFAQFVVVEWQQLRSGLPVTRSGGLVEASQRSSRNFASKNGGHPCEIADVALATGRLPTGRSVISWICRVL
jgi:hypothetical protein